MPSKQSTIGDRYLAGGDAELATSVYPSSFGLFRRKWCLPRSSRSRFSPGASVAPRTSCSAALPGGAGDQPPSLMMPRTVHSPIAAPSPHRRWPGRTHAPVAVSRRAFGRLDDRLRAQRSFGLASGPGVPGVFVAALGHSHHGQDLAEPVFNPQRLLYRRLLLVRRRLWVSALVFISISRSPGARRARAAPS